jgi:hypothetical protein
MPTKNNTYYKVIFLFASLFLTISCVDKNSSNKGKNNTETSGNESTVNNYSDSLLLDAKPEDTVQFADKNDEDVDMSLPEEKHFELVYNQVTEALNKGDIAAINKFIHPDWGIYIIDRPGAIDKVDTAKNIQSYYKKIYLGKKRLQGMMCKMEHRPIPAVPCDKVYKGCLSETTPNYHRVSDLKKALFGYGFKDNYLPKDSTTLHKFEKFVKRNTVNFDKAIGISFLFIDGKWYIGVIDLAKYTCSA